MAIVTFYSGQNFVTTPDLDEFDMVSATATQVQLSRVGGTDLWTFYGTFTIVGGEVTGGTATSTDYYVSGVKQWQITGGSWAASSIAGFFDVNDGAGLSQYIFAGNDTFNGSADDDAFNGFAGNDTLYGNAGFDFLVGGAGDDKLYGGTGEDTASYHDSAAGVTVSLALVTAQNTIGAGIDTLNSIERLYGSAFNDTLSGNTGANLIAAGPGTDTVNGDAGNDTLSGGDGTDTLSYASNWSGVIARLDTDAAQNTIGAGTDIILEFENLTGGHGNDNLVGTSGNNTLTGNDGNDRMMGGGGTDILNGGAGSDTASYTNSGAAVTVNLGIAGAQNTIGAGWDTLTSIENIVGGAFGDTLTGNAGSNTLEGGLGNDTLAAGTGVDTASYASSTAAVTVSLALAGAQNTIGAGTDTLSGFENVTGGSGNDTLTGNAGSNVLNGGKGNDILNGNGGPDFFRFDTALNATTNVDTINGFGSDDIMRLDNAIFTALTDGALAAVNFSASATGAAADANDYILYNTTTNALYYDADGSGAGAAIQFAQMSAGLVMSADDFIVV